MSFLLVKTKAANFDKFPEIVRTLQALKAQDMKYFIKNKNLINDIGFTDAETFVNLICFSSINDDLARTSLKQVMEIQLERFNLNLGNGEQLIDPLLAMY
jgi:hypothetical protein